MLQDASGEFHWRSCHAGYTCKINRCGAALFSQTLYWCHINETHPELLEHILIPKLMHQLHEKLTVKGELVDGFRQFRAVLKLDQGNEKMPPLYTPAFRELAMNPPKDKTSFDNIVIRFQNRDLYMRLDDQITQVILRAIHQFLLKHCSYNDTPPRNPINSEVPWPTAMKHAFGKFVNGHCQKCRDTVMHPTDDPNCFIRANHMSNADFVFLYDSMENMKSFDATLIGHEAEGWGTTPIMPKDETTNRSFNILNASDKRANAKYTTGTVGTTPVLLRKGCEPKPVFTNYFTHIKRMLDKMRRNIRQPIFIEFYSTYETSDPEDFNNMAIGWLAEFQTLTKMYPYYFIVLTPYPKIQGLTNIGTFIEEQTRTRLLNNIFAAYATKMGVCLLPTEGYLYSVPMNDNHSQWIWCKDREEPMRNNNSTPTREFYRRAGMLFHIAISHYHTMHKYHENAKKQLEKMRGVQLIERTLKDPNSDFEIETDYSDDEANNGNQNNTPNNGNNNGNKNGSKNKTSNGQTHSGYVLGGKI
jgi:hypothetical protein